MRSVDERGAGRLGDTTCEYQPSGHTLRQESILGNFWKSRAAHTTLLPAIRAKPQATPLPASVSQIDPRSSQAWLREVTRYSAFALGIFLFLAPTDCEVAFTWLAGVLKCAKRLHHLVAW